MASMPEVQEPVPDPQMETDFMKNQDTSFQSLRMPTFGFEAKRSYDATQELSKSRDNNFRLRPRVKDEDIWKRAPPDFRPQCFEPKPPKRNSRDAMKPWRYGSHGARQRDLELSDEQREDDDIKLPELMNARETNKEADFVTRFHVMDPAEARADSVRKGMFGRQMYTHPKHHDHRELPSLKSLGLPEFDTACDPDPFNIRFKSQRLGIIHGLNSKPPTERDVTGTQMCPPLKLPEKWESRLILSHNPWPLPAAQYSRFRPFWRSAQTVLLDRMENTLTSQWSQEKMEKMKRMQQKRKEQLPIAISEANL